MIRKNVEDTWSRPVLRGVGPIAVLYILLCVLEHTRVDNSSTGPLGVGPNWKQLVKFAVKGRPCSHGHTLKSLEEAKYLGLTITEKICNNVCTKANKSLGFQSLIRSTSLKEQVYL